MKKIIFILSLMLILPLVSAAQIEMKSQLDQGETLIARVSGIFLEPIFKENILLYRGHVRVPIDPEVAKISDDYYIYAQLLGKTENQYSLHIEDVQYVKAGRASEEDIVKDFSITNRTSDFLVDPGFIVTDQDFSIEVQNLQDHDITITIQTGAEASQSEQAKESDTGSSLFDLIFGTGSEEPQQTETGTVIDLKTGYRKSIDFKVENITEPTLDTITLSSTNSKYEILVYITPTKEAVEETQKSLMFTPAILNFSMATDSEATRIIYLYNDGKALLENINISVSESLKPYVTLSVEQVDELEENESVKITLSILSDEEEKAVEGDIRAKPSPSLQAYSAVFLNFVKDYQPLPGEELPPDDPAVLAVLKTCEEMNGTICQENEECTSETEFAKDGNCCLASCAEEKKDSRGKIIGWIIIIFVIILALWFFKVKFKKK